MKVTINHIGNESENVTESSAEIIWMTMFVVTIIRYTGRFNSGSSQRNRYLERSTDR
jgi:hypothetical protein